MTNYKTPKNVIKKRIFFSFRTLKIVLFLFLHLSYSALFSQVHIDEIVWDSTIPNSSEFVGIIKIKNRSTSTFSLKNFELRLSNGSLDQIRNPRIIPILSKSLLCGDISILPNGLVAIKTPLDKNVQTILLKNSNSEIISAVSWGDEHLSYKAMESGVWQAGPTVAIQEKGSLVAVNEGKSWSDWIATKQTVSSCTDNPTERKSQVQVLHWEAENGDLHKSSLLSPEFITTTGDQAVCLNGKKSSIEWNIAARKPGTYRMYVRYGNASNTILLPEGEIYVNSEKIANVDFGHNSFLHSEKHDPYWMNSYFTVHLDEGDNSVLLYMPEKLEKDKLFIDHLGMIVEGTEENENTTIVPLTNTEFTQTYCSSISQSASDEWISKFKLAEINYRSGSAAYQQYAKNIAFLQAGDSYMLEIVPKWSGVIYNAGFAVWIDYNRDGNFDNETEKVFIQSQSKEKHILGAIEIPETIADGLTKVRVKMEYDHVPENACGPIEWGEVEDYTVSLVGKKVSSGSESISDLSSDKALQINLSPNPVINVLSVQLKDEVISDIGIYSTQGRKLVSIKDKNQVDVSGLNSGTYFVMVNGKYTETFLKVE